MYVAIDIAWLTIKLAAQIVNCAKIFSSYDVQALIQEHPATNRCVYLYTHDVSVMEHSVETESCVMYRKYKGDSKNMGRQGYRVKRTAMPRYSPISTSCTNGEV